MIGPRTRRYLLANRNPVAALLEQMDAVDASVAKEARQETQRIIGPLADEAKRLVTGITTSATDQIEATKKETIDLLRHSEEKLNGEMAAFLKEKVRSLPLLKGNDGHTPIKNVDYFDGEPGKPGPAPRPGVDYPTHDTINAQIARTAAALYDAIGQVATTLEKQGLGNLEERIRDVIKAEAETIARALETLVGPDRYDYFALKNRPGIDVAQEMSKARHTLHRGGSTVSSTALNATEIPNSNRTSFTFAGAAAQPSYVVADNVWMRATTASGTVNWTWNSTTKQATMTVAPQDEIFAII